MWIEAKTNRIDKSGALYAGQSYDLTQDALDQIATEDKAAGRPAFRYKKIPAPWDAKKDMSLSQHWNYLAEIDKLNVVIAENRIKMDGYKTVVVGCNEDLAQFDKLSKEDQKSPLISLLIKRIQAKRALALVEVEIIDMENDESIQTRTKIEALIQKEKAKEQKAPTDKQYHPGKDDRTK